VRRFGVAKMARELQVDPTAIYQWIRGKVSPRPDKARAIIQLLMPLGRLRLEDIYDQRYARSFDADQHEG
jgi:DNA-binding XRE family transcriptional regulator